MKTLSIRWLLFAVATVSLLVPMAAVIALQSFDTVLVRQTESDLLAQSAVIAAAYQDLWSRSSKRPTGDPRPRHSRDHTFTPHAPVLGDLGRTSSPFPEHLPWRKLEAHEHALSIQLSTILKNAQVYNLSGVRVLGSDGCAVASSRDQIGTCFGNLPEVRTALQGRASATLRARQSDEPSPPLTSFRRRGELRVFVATPVWNDAELIGVVLLSRTAESGLEWLFKRRKGVLLFVAGMVALTILVSVAFSWSITRPLSKMIVLLQRSGPARALSSVSAPKEIHALAVALDVRAEQLESKNRYIAEFAANVSHELKTPLTSIRGAAELLFEMGDEMVPEQRGRFLQNIQEAVDRTERLVTRLLYLARLETPHSESDRETISVVAYADDLRARWGDEVTITVTGPDRMVARSDFEAVVGNLVDNALRYRRRHPVSVQIALPSERSQRLHLVVQDDGPGIAPENLGRIFDRFFTTERDRGGTGLGLAIVDAITRRCGGKVVIHSSPGETRAEAWM